MITATVGGMALGIAVITEVVQRLGVLSKIAAKAHLAAVQLLAITAGVAVLISTDPARWVQARLTDLFGLAGPYIAAITVTLSVIALLYLIAGIVRDTADGKTRAAAALVPFLAAMAPGGVGEVMGEGMGMLAQGAAWISSGLTGIG